MNLGVIYAPKDKPGSNLLLGRPILVAALDEPLHQVAELARRVALRIGRIDQMIERHMEVDGAFLLFAPAVVILDWLDHVGENTQWPNIGGSGHALQHALAGGIVSQSQRF